MVHVISHKDVSGGVGANVFRPSESRYCTNAIGAPFVSVARNGLNFFRPGE